MSTYPAYETVGQITDKGIEFLFLSEGKRNIIKAIAYVHTKNFNGKKVYNLGFGDYDLATDTILDHFASNNGDAYKVFSTVLSTIPGFFNLFADAMIMVNGSDRKRMNIYRKYVDKYYASLSKRYRFFGVIVTLEDQFLVEDYEKGEEIDMIFLEKM